MSAPSRNASTTTKTLIQRMEFVPLRGLQQVRRLTLI